MDAAVAPAENAGAQLLAEVEASVSWVEAALAVADDTLRDFYAAQNTAPGAVSGLGAKPEYWNGRLQGALSVLVMAVRGEMPE